VIGEESKFNANTEREPQVAMFRHHATRLSLRVLQVIPNERNIEVKVPLDFELKGSTSLKLPR
jgi:hypothetical protein